MKSWKKNASCYRNKEEKVLRFGWLLLLCVLLPLCFLVETAAEEGETLPREYDEFMDSLPDSVTDRLPEEAFSENAAAVTEAAARLTRPTYLLGILFRSFGGLSEELLPTSALLLGIVILSSVLYTVAGSLSPSMNRTVTLCVRLCTFCAAAAVSVRTLESLRSYFDALFATVAAFLPLSGVLYAMGGNLSAAASGSAALSTVLALCQSICSITVIPFFCICLAFSIPSALEGVGGVAGQTVSGAVKRWYTTVLGFVMAILTASLSAQSILAAKADGVAMRGVKYAVSGFVPVTGGTVSTTLGTLAASVELLRGAVGAVGIAALLLMLIPMIVELALLRGLWGISAFVAGMLGCAGEQRLFGEIGGLYGYLEGVAALMSAVFLIAMAVFASTAAAVR